MVPLEPRLEKKLKLPEEAEKIIKEFIEDRKRKKRIQQQRYYKKNKDMKVTCINDTKLPKGANVAKGQEYEVLEKFVNTCDQIVYIIAGVTNEGTTRFDMPWYGYSAERFAVVETVEEEAFEYNYALN